MVEWLDPAGRWHHTDPVDHLGVSSPRVIDVGLRDVATGDDELAEERSTDLEELSTDPEELSTDSEELVTSAVERWLAVTVEHAVAMAAAAAASPAAKGGGAAMGRGAAMGGDAADRGRRRDRHPSIISVEELDELSRDVRAGRFPDLDAAFEARRSEIAVRLSRRHRTDGSRECRLDARLSSRRHRVTIELESEDRPSHRECGATTPTLSLPPF